MKNLAERFFKWVASKFGYEYLFISSPKFVYSNIAMEEVHACFNVMRFENITDEEIKNILIKQMLPSIRKHLRIDRTEVFEMPATRYRATLYVGTEDRL